MDGDTTTDRLCVDAVCSVLANADRRAVLELLAADATETDVSAVVERLARARPGPAERTERKLRLLLYHQHLPKMAAAGVVEYDADAERVALTPAGARLETVRQRIDALFADDPA